jgi:hypothetical protein
MKITQAKNDICTKCGHYVMWATEIKHGKFMSCSKKYNLFVRDKETLQRFTISYSTNQKIGFIGDERLTKEEIDEKYMILDRERVSFDTKSNYKVNKKVTLTKYGGRCDEL